MCGPVKLLSTPLRDVIEELAIDQTVLPTTMNVCSSTKEAMGFCGAREPYGSGPSSLLAERGCSGIGVFFFTKFLDPSRGIRQSLAAHEIHHKVGNPSKHGAYH